MGTQWVGIPSCANRLLHAGDWGGVFRITVDPKTRPGAAEQTVLQRLPKLGSAIAADPPHDGSLNNGRRRSQSYGFATASSLPTFSPS